MKNTQVIEDVYKEDLLADVVSELHAAEKVNDRLAFGSYRQELADEFKDRLVRAKRKIDNIIKRIES